MTELIQSDLTPGRTAATLSLGRVVVEFIRGNSEVVAYVRRAILEDHRVARGLFDSILELSRKLNRRLFEEGLLRADLDPIWTPLLRMILVLGPLLLGARPESLPGPSFTNRRRPRPMGNRG